VVEKGKDFVVQFPNSVKLKNDGGV
jgi:hypothetical protein